MEITLSPDTIQIQAALEKLVSPEGEGVWYQDSGERCLGMSMTLEGTTLTIAHINGKNNVHTRYSFPPGSRDIPDIMGQMAGSDGFLYDTLRTNEWFVRGIMRNNPGIGETAVGVLSDAINWVAKRETAEFDTVVLVEGNVEN